MRPGTPVERRAFQLMPWLLGLAAASSLLHFAHNAEHLAEYPNLPASWTRADVYWAWVAVSSLGLMGYAFYRSAFCRTGLTLLTIYAGLGFGGLLHYTRAPVAHHSAAMNFTIWVEVASALALLINVACAALRPRQADRHSFE